MGAPRSPQQQMARRLRQASKASRGRLDIQHHWRIRPPVAVETRNSAASALLEESRSHPPNVVNQPGASPAKAIMNQRCRRREKRVREFSSWLAAAIPKHSANAYTRRQLLSVIMGPAALDIGSHRGQPSVRARQDANEPKPGPSNAGRSTDMAKCIRFIISRGVGRMLGWAAGWAGPAPA